MPLPLARRRVAPQSLGSLALLTVRLRRQCFLDLAAQVASAWRCPSCDAYLPAGQEGSSAATQAARILTRYHSEGGVQEDYDIFPDIREEAYLFACPAERPARAFLTMCSGGDVMGILGLLGDGLQGDDAMKPEALLRYQDPLHEMKTGCT